MFTVKSFFFVFLSFSILTLFSCKQSTKTDKYGSEVDKSDMVTVEDKDLTESDEDLMTVDYKEFYDQLSPHGQWVEVTPKDLGLKLKTSSLENFKRENSLFAALTGLRDANAAADADLGAFFVWKPSSDMAVGVTAGSPELAVGTAAGYTPYANGQWVNTDNGWYFQAPTPYEEITSHYGRWTFTPDMGWVWLPGRVWAPAWVDMRENDDFVAWAPFPPGTYVSGTTVIPPVIEDDRYVVVQKSNFVEPTIYKYMYLENKNKVMIKEMSRTGGLVVQNNTIVNKGPEVSSIEKAAGKKIETVKIKRVSNPGDVKYTSSEFSVFTPKFTKVKSVEKVKTAPVTKPNSYKTAGEVKGKEEKKEEKEIKKEEKEMKKESKEKEKEMKKEGKEKGYEKEKEPKGKEKEPMGKEPKGKEKEPVNKEPKGKEKGNYDKGPKEKDKK